MMSAVLSSSATWGAGSKVWLLVPSGTMPSTSTRSPPMLAAIEVIGATVVATFNAPVLSGSSEHAERATMAVSATTADRTAGEVCRRGRFMLTTLLQPLCACKLFAISHQWQVGRVTRGGVGDTHTARPGYGWSVTDSTTPADAPPAEPVQAAPAKPVEAKPAVSAKTAKAKPASAKDEPAAPPERTPEQIQSDIDAAQRRLADQVDELSDRLAPQSLAEDAIGRVKGVFVEADGTPKVKPIAIVAGTLTSLVVLRKIFHRD